jgi:DNA-binding transcriptional ArsR family regulator
MSPLYSNMGWDPSHLRLDQHGVKASQGSSRKGRRVSPVRDQFIAGPIGVPWVREAGRLGIKALLVGLLLWYLKGLRKSNTFTVSNLMAKEWGIAPDAKSRALKKLEKAGLISIERRGKRSPQVTLLIPGNTSTKFCVQLR